MDGSETIVKIPPPGEFYFTVGKLMDILKTLPPDLPVLTSGFKSGYDNFHHPEVVKMTRGKNEWFEYGEFEVAVGGEVRTFDAVLLIRVNRDG